MSAVTVAMLLAIDITDKALNKVGRYPLTNKEREILIDAGYNSLDIENPPSDLIGTYTKETINLRQL